ncbi:hypothetical protein AB0E08_31170 [Streptomyces sp. NPDC048281]|uniref:hypothetical protein n=1 Tax=Streptomyces sp. NPDC048281 TaxID=3154715 RepID=UPI0034447A2C
MRMNPATPAEVESWLAVLHQRGHLYRAEPGPQGIWTVQRRHHDRPWTLHHPVLAMDWIEAVLREVQQQHPEASR